MDYSRDINEAGTHLLDIINDILDISKADAGKLQLSYEEVSLPKIISKCVTVLSDRARKGVVDITTDVPGGLPLLIADQSEAVPT
mgnify:CR=1 FL=1